MPINISTQNELPINPQSTASTVDQITERITDTNDFDGSFVLFGDSITSNCHRTLVVPSAISRSGNVVTVTGSAHKGVVGSEIRISNVMPDDFNGTFTIDTASTNSFTFKSTGTQGSGDLSGSAHPSGGLLELKSLSQLDPHGMWMWVNGLMNGGLYLVCNCARGGWTADYAANHIDELEATVTATGKKARNAYIRMGINDIAHGRTVAQVITALTTIINHNIVMGRRVFLDTILPLGSSHANFDADTNATIASVNRWISKTAPNLLGIIPVDTYTTMVDPATGAAKTGMLGSELIHPNPCAMVNYIAQAIKAVFARYISTNCPLPGAIVDTYGASTISLNMHDKGPWVTTSGGATSGTITGSVCSGFTVTESGVASSVAAQINTNAAGYVEQQLTLEGTLAAGNTMDFNFTGTVARLAEGAKYRLMFQIELSNLDSASGNIRGFEAYVACVAAGYTAYYYTGGTTTTYPLNGALSGTYTYTIVSEPMTIPPGLTAFNPHIRLEANGALGGSGAVMKISRIGLVREQ
jgi:hypothetical protein